MKKTVILGILGLAAGVASSYGQGFIQLDNYNSYGGAGGPLVTFGAGSGGTVGTGLTSAWTIGLYFADGSVAGDTTAGSGSVSPLLTLGTGSGSTAVFSTTTFGNNGEFFSNVGFNTGFAVGDTVTVELVAYLTSSGSYANDLTARAHSAAFTLTTAAININPKPLVGDFMSTFAVTPVPEPTTLALAGLGGLASLVALRRKKA